MPEQTEHDPDTAKRLADMERAIQRFANCASQAYTKAMALHAIPYKQRLRIYQTAQDLMSKRAVEILKEDRA